ncbi:uncharacterized protein DUF5050 [Herbinix hemicellulosilytica]|uniref:Prolow-density lipoprotein receptor-related protein 1-like beta-propeller domain-containing protein n=1 Tax=Herbinix hemicellulosilytica TaxID=1564487 RepID=A0A0H5SEG2_HERHM|nr:DUF5050 domain-containing protein [Herbinix hemicellulosilytica]RBP60103.1 uncharacterized protein DUF5050 [Herbinix hemicellulosilytica]CRZ33827.1 hypothetical protein HHT355_0623 [Herbinix hemicellulosilytica]
MSTIKKVLLTLFIITTLSLAGILLYSWNRTFANDENLIGNTAGNIYNGGLFCEKDGIIYFSNDKDNGSLYMMKSDATDIKKLHDDKAAYINVDENYIYYIRAVDTKSVNSGSSLPFNNTGIYRINRNGEGLKLISSKPGSYITLKGNHLYYQNYDVDRGVSLYRNQTDGSHQRLLLIEPAIPAAVINDRLYYTEADSDYSISYLDLSSFTTGTFIEGDFAYPVFFGDYIYYIDRSAGTINRMSLNGTDRTVLVKEKCSAYNITNSGKYLYYQVNDADNSKLCRMNLETSAVEILMEGHFKQIHVTENYVFFKDMDNTNTYIIPADGKAKVSIFNPPDLNP